MQGGVSIGNGGGRSKYDDDDYNNDDDNDNNDNFWEWHTMDISSTISPYALNVQIKIYLYDSLLRDLIYYANIM